MSSFEEDDSEFLALEAAAQSPVDDSDY
eukprot:COSAG05_NODE_16161_length_352_cov_0.822134_1_plen_27_part_10